MKEKSEEYAVLRLLSISDGMPFLLWPLCSAVYTCILWIMNYHVRELDIHLTFTLKNHDVENHLQHVSNSCHVDESVFLVYLTNACRCSKERTVKLFRRLDTREISVRYP